MQHLIQIKNGIKINVNVSIKIIVCLWKKNYTWNPSTFICENSRYLKSIVDDSVIVCDKFIASWIVHQQM